MDAVFFMGACTREGFVSHYDTLTDEVERLHILKGGSGCGKSTFMKTIAQRAKEAGQTVYPILCASDPDSYDALILPKLATAFVDGTSPHVLEPRLCGGRANYLNFGAFYDREAMAPNEDGILKVQKKNKEQYFCVQACLGSAGHLLDCMQHFTEKACYREEILAIAECICLSCLKPLGRKGRVRRRFLHALTPKGRKLLENTPSALCGKVYVLQDNYGLALPLLEKVLEKALRFGYDCLVCDSPLRKGPAHLLLPEADTAIVTACGDFPYHGESFCRIDLDTTLPYALRQELEFYRLTAGKLLEQAVAHLRTAKQLHDRIEAMCKPFVDFEAVNRQTEATLHALGI